MAEGTLADRLLGEDERAGEAEGEGPAAALDPFAAAAAMEVAKSNPELAARAGAYFQKQGRLVDIQTEHLHEQREVALSHLKLRRFTERLRAGTQLFFILLSGGLTFAVLVMVYDAATSRSVVVDSFQASPALTGRGLSGEVVAGGVLDELLTLQAATRSASKGLYTTSAWGGEVKIEVPETGVSLGDVGRLLHQRLGHDLHMGGDLVLADGGGLALTVRGDGIPARTFTGGADALDKLTVQAAEYLYGRSQPLQFATYLVTNGRSPDAIAFIPKAMLQLDDDDARAWLARMWGNALGAVGREAEAADKYRLAISFKPDDWASRSNLMSTDLLVGGEEAALLEAQAFTRAADAAPFSQRPDIRYRINAALMVMDLPLVLQANLADAALNRQGTQALAIDGPIIADTYMRMHDIHSAERYLALSDSEDLTTKAEANLFAGQQALDRGDPAAAIPPLAAFLAGWRANAGVRVTFPDAACVLGQAQGLAGQVAAAEATFREVGAYSRCFALHGRVLERAGDLAGAERVWSEGVAAAPDASLVYLERGLSELRRGDLARAEADLSAANSRSPHFADPLKGLADLRARQGRWHEAAELYHQARVYAPAWPELLQAQSVAGQHL